MPSCPNTDMSIGIHAMWELKCAQDGLHNTRAQEYSLDIDAHTADLKKN